MLSDNLLVSNEESEGTIIHAGFAYEGLGARRNFTETILTIPHDLD